jgi:K+-sensing histidine kinase KdpD
MNNYKFGIKPKKRKIKSLVDQCQNDFVDLVDTLEKEKQNQNRIIASISHDIKTPLTSILGYSELLKKEQLPNETKISYVNKINTKAITMKEIIEEFDNYLSCNIKDQTKSEKINIK